MGVDVGGGRGGEGIWPPTNAQVDYASLQVREFFHS